MRKPFVAGNWKMNKSMQEAQTLVSTMLEELGKINEVEIVLCPPFTSLMAVAASVVGTKIGTGAQNMYWKDSGAYTGEIAPGMVKEFANYVILGHSERRAYFGETDETVNNKLKAAFAHDLTPIVCVGETLEENEAGKTAEVITRQILQGFKDLTSEQAHSVVIAYEPVWAIGTGKAASGAGANAVLADIIRPVFASTMYGEKAAQAVRILYGGSVTPANADEFFQQPDIDGALVGGASLKPDFIGIAKAAAKRM